MSEQLRPASNEAAKNIETSREQLESIRSELESKAQNKEDKSVDLEEISNQVEQYAISGKELSPSEKDTKHHPVFVNKQLKDMAYSRAMTRVRKKLSLPSRAFSKVMHSKLLDKPSEIAEKTIARPSGMLGGATFAALGSILLLWITKHNGYSYNYLVVLILFAIGLLVGLLTEVFIRLIKKARP